MQEFIDMIKLVFTNMQAVGWSPWPLVATVAAIFGVRQYFEADVLDVNTPEAKKRDGQVKLAAYAVGYAVSVIACFGFDWPKDAQERIQVFMFSILNVVLGYNAKSLWAMGTALMPGKK